MNFKWIAFAAVAALALTGCASTPRMSVSDGWNDRPGSISVTYAMIDQENREDEFRDDFPGYAGDFNQWFSEQLVTQLSAQTGIPADKIYLQALPPSKIEERHHFDAKLGYLGETTKNFPVCMGSVVANMPEADIHICMDDVKFTKIYESYAGLLGLLFFAGEFKVDGTYSIYGKRDRLAYGDIKSSEEFMFGIEDDEWYNSVEQVVGHIVEGTPLQK